MISFANIDRATKAVLFNLSAKGYFALNLCELAEICTLLNFAKESWSNWLNNLENLVMLGRLPLPNTPEQQIAYMLKNEDNVSRIIFMV